MRRFPANGQRVLRLPEESWRGTQEAEMSRHTSDGGSVQESVPSPPLPAGHVLNSGAVLFPGAFDQYGCPLILFPADGQDKLSSELSKAEVVDFINYFLCLHKKQQEKNTVVSVVADLRQASPHTTRFIAETLLLLEFHKRTVHTLYVIQPKKDTAKLLLKLLTPSAKSHAASFKKVLLKDVSELSNYIDRSQLITSLGGYLFYCHRSWVSFIKEIDTFMQDFLSVVQRLPWCISTLQALSRLPLPSTFTELQRFCSINEAKFLKLRRELRLDELLRHCESVVEKLRCPEREPCYQAMAGTTLFTHTAFDMLQNHSRITAAVEKVEQLWQQAFSKARLQLRVFQLREEALQVTEQTEHLLQNKLQPYKIEIANDAAKAKKLMSDFETSIHTPAMALVHRAEDVIHTVTEILQVTSPTRERWVHDLERLKEKLRSAVHFILQNLRAVSTYYHHYNKADSWYRLVLSENFLQELLSDVGDESPKRNWATLPARKHKLSAFLKKNPPPYMEELVHLAHLSNVVPDDDVRQAGTQMSHRCTILRKLLISSSPVAVGHLQLALQWQYEFLRRGCRNPPEVQETESRLPKRSTTKDAHLLGSCPPTAFSGMVSAEAKPPSLSSFDSGFDGAGSSQLEASGWKEEAEGLSGLLGSRESMRPKVDQPQTHAANICISGSEDPREEFDFVGNPPRTSVQVIPKVTVDSLNFEIKVTRSAALPNNPWLSLPVDDLENSYTVTITQNPTPKKRDPPFPDPCADTNSTGDQPPHMEALNKTHSRVSGSSNGRQRSQSSLEDPELSPICKILSSTITDGRDQFSCTTEGVPTLLWDSYDLHNLSQESVNSVMDVSVKEQDELEDWDVKEQDGLNKVEKMLVKTDEILEEEESVLAQEAILDVLVRSEQGHWPAWDSDNHLSVMSSSELAEAGVLGLEDPFDLEDPEDISGSATCTEAPSGADVSDCRSQTNLLRELRKVHLLDELIREENLKIHELRRCEETPSDEPSVHRPAVTSQLLEKNKEREAFREHLEREKREVEILEKSLDMESNVKHQSRAKRVVRCSIMESVVTEEDQALCDQLLSGVRNKSPSSQSAPQLEEDVCADGIQTERCLDGDEPHPAPRCQVDSVSNRSTWNSCCVAEEPADEVRPLPPTSMCNTDSDPSAGDENMCKPETKPDDGSFDPGGESPPRPQTPLFPVKEHDAGSLVNAALSSSSAQDPTVEQLSLVSLPNSDTVEHSLFLHPNVKEHSNNNNNHLVSETSYVSLEPSTEGATSVTPVQKELLLEEDEVQAFPLADECPRQSPPQLPPASGFDELDRDPSEELPSSQVMRTSSSRSPAFQVPLNVNVREMTDFKTPIVLDTGSGLMKAGFADQDIPNVIFPTIIGQPKYEEIMNGNLEREAYIGHEAQHMRGVLALKRPIKNGIICNWDEMEKIWHHTFQQLCVDPEDHPVLLTEAAMNPLQNRQRTVEIMFECFCVPFTYVAMQAVLALYAAGRCTGVVLDSGDGLSHSVPVFEGYCLPHAVQRFPLAGVDVTMQLKTLLREQGVCLHTSAEMEIVREMKEKCCRVALNYDAEVTRGGSSCGEMHYTMPDGQIVTLSTERFRAPEILFKPELIGRDHYGMHESVFKSILSSDIDLRRCFLGNIVLSGGNTLLSGLPERLQAEVRGLVPADMASGVCVTSPEDRDFSVWSGGAALANLHTFSSAWISQEEYEEFGPQIVFRKCF